MPAQAGIQDIPVEPINKFLDSRLRGKDKGELEKLSDPWINESCYEVECRLLTKPVSKAHLIQPF